MKQIILFILLSTTSKLNCRQDQIDIVFFSRTHEIEKSSSHCGDLETGLIYTFVKDKYKNNDSLFYGFIPCPDLRDQNLFVYDRKLKIKFRNFDIDKVDNLIILNQRKYMGKKVYFITEIN
jgi:hypothetical protein